MSDQQRDPDLDWLYRREPTPEATRIYSPEEQARLSASRPAPSPPPWHTPQQASGYPAAQHVAPPSGPRPPQQPPGGRGLGRRPRRRHPIRRIIVALVLAWVVFMVGTPIYAWTVGNTVKTEHQGTLPPEQPGTAVLLVGSDGRDQLTEQQRRELGTGDTEGRRTDSMMLLYKPPSGKSALISLPRDSWVSVPGKGNAKLNAAYAWGGAPLLIQTVEENTGIRIDGYLEVGFLGVVEAVDAVGGVEVCPQEPINDQDSHLELPAGCQTLNGKTALGYVRMRKADPRGDVGRMERQREIIGKVAKKALNPLTILNPVSYWNLNLAAAHTLGRGTGTGPLQVLDGIQVFMGSAVGSGYSLSVPVSDANAMRGDQSVMIWDEKASKEVFDAVKRGNTEVLAQYSK